MWHCIHKASAPSAANGAFSLEPGSRRHPDPAPGREAVKGTWTGWLVGRQLHLMMPPFRVASLVAVHRHNAVDIYFSLCHPPICLTNQCDQRKGDRAP
jgi:hypothetical protein